MRKYKYHHQRSSFMKMVGACAESSNLLAYVDHDILTPLMPLVSFYTSLEDQRYEIWKRAIA